MTQNTIGKVAQRAGVGVETVRFYERRGLVPQPARPANGFRIYPDDVIDRIRFIRHAKVMGFTLAEIHDLLSLRVAPRSNCTTIRQRVDEKLTQVEAKIAGLKKIKRQLQRLVTSCDTRTPTDDCPVLEALQ